MRFKIVLYIFILILVFILGFLLSRLSITGRSVQQANETGNEYTWTKAICNEKNECIDVLILCANGQAISIKPVSWLVQHPENWTDPRGNSSVELCS